MTDKAQAIDKPMGQGLSREERIREVAYRRFLERTEREPQGSGNATSDWLEAQAQVDADESSETVASPVEDQGAEDESPTEASGANSKASAKPLVPSAKR